MVKVSRVLIASLLVVVLCAPLASATTSRVISLANTGDYINDDSNLFRWYGTLPSYTKLVLAEIGQYTAGTANYQALGFTHNWGEDHWLGTWGIFLLQGSLEDMSFFAYNPLPTMTMGPSLGNLAQLANGHPTTKFVLNWGKSFSAIDLGIMFTRSDYMYEPSGGTKSDISFTTFGGGVRWDMRDDLYGDAVVTLGSAGGDTLSGWDAGFAWEVGARVFWEWADDVTLVPLFEYRTADYSFKRTALDPHGDKWSDLLLGVSFNFDVNTSNMLVFATEIDWAKWEYSRQGTPSDQSEWKFTTIPRFRIALESDIRSWLTSRIGATKAMTKVELRDAAGDKDTYTSTEFIPDPPGNFDDFEWFLGVGFHIAEFDIDAVVSNELPFEFGYFLTGWSAGTAPVGRISATYHY